MLNKILKFFYKNVGVSYFYKKDKETGYGNIIIGVNIFTEIDIRKTEKILMQSIEVDEIVILNIFNL